MTLSAASGMQSGSEEGRGEGQKRDKYVILVYGSGMTQHSPLFLVQQRKCEAPPPHSHFANGKHSAPLEAEAEADTQPAAKSPGEYYEPLIRYDLCGRPS